MALSRTGRLSEYSATSYGTGSWETGSFTPSANSLLIVVVERMSQAGSGDLGAVTVSGGSLSYTNIGNVRRELSWAHRIDAFYAPVGASPAAMTLTVDDDNTIYQWAIAAFDYTGYNTGTPVDGYVTTGSTDCGNADETITLAATPTADDVSLCVLASICSDLPDPLWGTGWTELYEVGSGGAAIVCVAERTASTSTAVTVDDTYRGGGTLFSAHMFAFFVKMAEAVAGKPMYAYVQQ